MGQCIIAPGGWTPLRLCRSKRYTVIEVRTARDKSKSQLETMTLKIWPLCFNNNASNIFEYTSWVLFAYSWYKCFQL